MSEHKTERIVDMPENAVTLEVVFQKTSELQGQLNNPENSPKAFVQSIMSILEKFSVERDDASVL